MKNSIESMLKLEKLIFDKIEFNRINWEKSKEDVQFEVEVHTSQHKEEELYKIELNLRGHKPDEYILEITLLGFFSFQGSESITDELKDALVRKNTIAIMMPYMRSQLSLLTTQPGVDCVMLPIINVNQWMEGQK